MEVQRTMVAIDIHERWLNDQVRLGYERDVPQEGSAHYALNPTGRAHMGSAAGSNATWRWVHEERAEMLAAGMPLNAGEFCLTPRQCGPRIRMFYSHLHKTTAVSHVRDVPAPLCVVMRRVGRSSGPRSASTSRAKRWRCGAIRQSQRDVSTAGSTMARRTTGSARRMKWPGRT